MGGRPQIGHNTSSSMYDQYDFLFNYSIYLDILVLQSDVVGSSRRCLQFMTFKVT